MDALRYLTSFFLKVALAIILFVFVWWFVKIVTPTTSVSNETATTTKNTIRDLIRNDWLPSPRTYSGIFKSTSTIAQPIVYTPGSAYRATTINTVQDTAYQRYAYPNKDGVVIGASKETSVHSTTTTNKTAVSSSRKLSIRNLSIYEGGHVYTGLSFVGEARSEFFREGKFPIVVVDQTGRVVGVTVGEAQANWSVPGWVRFQAKVIHTLPSSSPCTMVFEEALTQSERGRQPLRVPLPIRCN